MFMCIFLCFDMRLHREGHSFLIRCFILFCVVGFLSVLWFPWWVWHPIVFHLLVFYFLFVRFFRNPDRSVVRVDDHSVLAPADGTVVVIERTVEDEFIKQECIQISVFMSVFNVHVNRYPVSGTVEYVRYHPGKFLVARNPKSSTDNERNTVVVRCADNRLVLVRQIAGALARRIIGYARPGVAVTQGEDMGFIKFGSRVDVFLPPTAQVHVRLGEKVIGNRTVLATW